ncbi:hypothetical protein N9M11_02730 [Flavobacteriaceae bacterium]|uniref:hypothetical protein n=1 Tax=Candidatus Arcticimaribacter forsetii TaxID=2820661 RepID=UPI00207749E3|nr:hypothetical protein [Candidatus Arcticimaribacter forsetii]MDA8699018.1 hypothetical protein [Flavobacteriaceae bacterium]MDB2329979.1 hypothetical protein [Flavobacteriaceae bacterium]MDB2345781.1 hypothetical protein [Flavobacteriaceae bacterium]MDB4620793.1 hypothetical protein [Flavobacteriaceae bacterium]MDB4674550.1 hypothetical protein [Flavobacteriaceae bacterium]
MKIIYIDLDGVVALDRYIDQILTEKAKKAKMKLTSEQLEEAGRAFRKIEICDKYIQCDLFNHNKMIIGKFLSKMEKY